MLGSASEADDAVQEAWLRLSRSERDAIENLGALAHDGALARLPERAAGPPLAAGGAARARRPRARATAPTPSTRRCSPTRSGSRCSSCSRRSRPRSASRSCCTTCSACPFEEIAPIVGRNAPAARQLASRARRRVRRQEDPGTSRPAAPGRSSSTRSSPRPATASSTRLLALLDPDVVLTADETAAAMGAAAELRGADAVAAFSRRARGATPALLDGAAALVWLVDGQRRASSTASRRAASGSPRSS